MTEQEPARGPRRPFGIPTLLAALAVVLALLVGAAAAVVLSRARDESAVGPPAPAGAPLLGDAPAPRERMALPEVVLPGFADGAPVDLRRYEGAPLVVNFWASWCAPCVAEMPHFQRVADATAGRVAFLGVNVRDAPGNARAFVERLQVRYDLASDPDGEFFQEVRAIGMPTTLFVDPSGTVVFRHTGGLTATQLEELLATHLRVQVHAAEG